MSRAAVGSNEPLRVVRKLEKAAAHFLKTDDPSQMTPELIQQFGQILTDWNVDWGVFEPVTVDRNSMIRALRVALKLLKKQFEIEIAEG